MNNRLYFLLSTFILLPAWALPVTITIDGSFGDWASVSPIVSDADDASTNTSKPDFTDLYITNDATHLFIRYTSAHSFFHGNPQFFSNDIYVDYDNNLGTGWDVRSEGVLGADLRVNGNGLWQPTPSNSFGTSLGNTPISPSGSFTFDVEVSIDRTHLVGNTDIRVWFVSEPTYDKALDNQAVSYTVTEPSHVTDWMIME